MAALDLIELQQVLEAHAPLLLAEEWDNVGWIIEAPHPNRVRRLLLTIDLTTRVAEEAIAGEIDVIVAYHPLIFDPLRRLLQSDPQARTIMRLIRKGLSVYSPHTALDAAERGVNDWLADGFGPGKRAPIQPTPAMSEDAGLGQGRFLELDQAVSLDTCVDWVKQHLRLSHLRVAASDTGLDVQSVALCAGAGGSVVGSITADLILTGEMRHHDVLSATESGTHVILCDHTNTERGFLTEWQQRLVEDLPSSIEVLVSATDSDPLTIL